MCPHSELFEEGTTTFPAASAATITLDFIFDFLKLVKQKRQDNPAF
jgi:hypothetical protein